MDVKAYGMRMDGEDEATEISRVQVRYDVSQNRDTLFILQSVPTLVSLRRIIFHSIVSAFCETFLLLSRNELPSGSFVPPGT